MNLAKDDDASHKHVAVRDTEKQMDPDICQHSDYDIQPHNYWP